MTGWPSEMSWWFDLQSQSETGECSSAACPPQAECFQWHGDPDGQKDKHFEGREAWIMAWIDGP